LGSVSFFIVYSDPVLLLFGFSLFFVLQAFGLCPLMCFLKQEVGISFGHLCHEIILCGCVVLSDFVSYSLATSKNWLSRVFLISFLQEVIVCSHLTRNSGVSLWTPCRVALILSEAGFPLISFNDFLWFTARWYMVRSWTNLLYNSRSGFNQVGSLLYFLKALGGFIIVVLDCVWCCQVLALVEAPSVSPLLFWLEEPVAVGSDILLLWLSWYIVITRRVEDCNVKSVGIYSCVLYRVQWGADSASSLVGMGVLLGCGHVNGWIVWHTLWML